MVAKQNSSSKNSDNTNVRLAKSNVKSIDGKTTIIENCDYNKKDKCHIVIEVNKGIETKKDKEVKGITKGKDSEKDKNRFEGKSVTNAQSITVDKKIIDNIIEDDNVQGKIKAYKIKLLRKIGRQPRLHAFNQGIPSLSRLKRKWKTNLQDVIIKQSILK